MNTAGIVAALLLLRAVVLAAYGELAGALVDYAGAAVLLAVSTAYRRHNRKAHR